MNAREWIDFLQSHDVDIYVSSRVQTPWLINGDGAYLPASDRIILTPRLNKEVVFHELAHWTAHETRLARDIDTGPLFANANPDDLEESIAWEFTKLMVKRFGGGSRNYYRYAPLYSMKSSEEVKFFGRQAYEFIRNEFEL